MEIGVCYHPELWVYPFGGTTQEPEARWIEDAKLMADAGVTVARIAENCWGLCEPADGKFNFAWLKRVMDILADHGIKTVLATPTSSPPLWLLEKHPEILPVDQNGLRCYPGGYKTACLNSDIYWEYCRRLVREMAMALGNHPNLLAWQIDNNPGEHCSNMSFNEDTKRDWAFWLEAKYETLEKLNNLLGLRWWGQIVQEWKQVPPPMRTVACHNTALELEWTRFCSDTVVQFVKMLIETIRQITPNVPTTVNLGHLSTRIDHFDLAETVEFISGCVTLDNSIPSPEIALQLDRLRSLKQETGKCPDGSPGFWIMGQPVSIPTTSAIHNLPKPGLLRCLAYQCVARGANAVVFIPWRQPRIGPEKFAGGILPHHVRRENRLYRELAQLGEEFKLISAAIKDTVVRAPVAILYTYDNQWATELAMRRHLPPVALHPHIRLFYDALYEKNITADFIRPLDNLSKYRLIIAPSLHLLSGAEADAIKLYVQNGGVVIGTCNTGLVNEHHIAPDQGYPLELTDLFGLEVLEFDVLSPEEENHLIFKGGFPASQMHPAKYWCDIIEPKDCEIIATFASSFYAGRPAITINSFGMGKAIYIGTVSHRPFYVDLVRWLRELCDLQPPIKVPNQVEVTLRESGEKRVYVLINKSDSPAKIHFLKRMEDLITGAVIAGQYDLSARGILVVKETA